MRIKYPRPFQTGGYILIPARLESSWALKSHFNNSIAVQTNISKRSRLNVNFAQVLNLNHTGLQRFSKVLFTHLIDLQRDLAIFRALTSEST